MEKSTDIIMSHWQMFESTFYFAGGGGGGATLNFTVFDQNHCILY